MYILNNNALLAAQLVKLFSCSVGCFFTCLTVQKLSDFMISHLSGVGMVSWAAGLLFNTSFHVLPSWRVFPTFFFLIILEYLGHYQVAVAAWLCIWLFHPNHLSFCFVSMPCWFCYHDSVVYLEIRHSDISSLIHFTRDCFSFSASIWILNLKNSSIFEMLVLSLRRMSLECWWALCWVCRFLLAV